MYNIYYSMCHVYSVVENLMAFLFYSLHLSLEVQKVRLAVVFLRVQSMKSNIKCIHLQYLVFLGFGYLIHLKGKYFIDLASYGACI